MGGTVAETIRRENGEVIKMARKTGAYNWMFFTKEFCEKNFDLAIDDHIKSFIEMKEDYQSGEPYKYNMSPVYGWCNQTVPIAYGLVVIDFKTKKIHSMQSYDNPGYHYVSMLSKHVILDTDVEENFDYLIKNNLLYTLNEENEIKDINEFFGVDFNLEKLRNKLHSNFSKIKQMLGKDELRSLVFYPKIFDDFEFVKYDETPEGTINFFENLIKDDFSFTQEEIEMWKDRIKEFDSDEFLNEKDYENDELIDAIIEKNKNSILDKIDLLQNNISNKNTQHKSTLIK